MKQHRYRLNAGMDANTRKGRALADSIDAAAAEGAITGPVPVAQLAEIMRRLDAEWDAADELDRRMSDIAGRGTQASAR